MRPSVSSSLRALVLITALTDGYVFMKAGFPAVDFDAYGGKSYYHDPRDSWEMQEPSTLEDAAKILYWSLINAADAE